MFASDAGTSVKSCTGTMWQYAKVEMAPPLTQSLLSGPLGKSLEFTVGKTADGVLAALRESIKQIDAAELQRVKLIEQKMKAALEEKKKEVLKAQEEAKKKLAAAKAVAAKKMSKPTPAPAAKVDTKPAKEPPKPKQKAKRKDPKKSRSDPKSKK